MKNLNRVLKYTQGYGSIPWYTPGFRFLGLKKSPIEPKMANFKNTCLKGNLHRRQF